MTMIDLNADLGEGFGRWQLGDDEAMLDLVTSANVACGFHAGDPRSGARVGQLRRAGPDRCPGRLPRSRGLRPPLHRLHPADPPTPCSTRSAH